MSLPQTDMRQAQGHLRNAQARMRQAQTRSSLPHIQLNVDSIDIRRNLSIRT